MRYLFIVMLLFVFSCDNVSSPMEETDSSNSISPEAVKGFMGLGMNFSGAVSKNKQMNESRYSEPPEKRSLRGDAKGLFERIDIGNAIETFSQFFEKYVISPIINTFNYIAG